MPKYGVHSEVGQLRTVLFSRPGLAHQRLTPGNRADLLFDNDLWALGATDFVIPPVPNTLFQRDPSCWIYDVVTCNPMYWPARKSETLLQRVVYKFHPRFKDADFTIWWGDSDASFGAASLEGGDVM